MFRLTTTSITFSSLYRSGGCIYFSDAALHQDVRVVLYRSFDVRERSLTMFRFIVQLVCQLLLLGRHGGDDSYFHK